MQSLNLCWNVFNKRVIALWFYAMDEMWVQCEWRNNPFLS